MKEKLASFLVNKSRIILAVFIVLAVAFACLIPFVNRNYDMTEYLPDDSAMKKGLDIMEAEFGKEESSELSVMFSDLKSQSQKDAVCRELEDIRFVEEVDYKAEDSDYNKDGHTLYKLSCDHDQYSDQAKSIWNEVNEKYGKSHSITLGGSINSANVSGLPLWIAALAVLLVFLIILIMASSWIEPLAMLITIAVAVMINMGSYIFFPSISNTTFGIVAILQLALSMDYSIMLMNRYRQERTESDKFEAMKKSLSLSFGAISGSSLTTFAGLLALVFMSFKMGADIGLALAKGVIISLICIFTVLQALIIAFDDLMLRTPKKTLKFSYPRLSRFQYRFRVPITVLFVVIFGLSFMAKDNVDYTYAQGSETEIDKVFGCSNSIVMIYDTEDGEAAEQLAEELEDKDEVNSATCYEGTLGKERRAADMNSFIEDMAEEGSESDDGSDMDMDTDMIRLIYYDYHGEGENIRMTLPEFVVFLQSDVIEDENFGESIDDKAKESIDEMAKMTDREKLTSPMNSRRLAGFFGMKKSQAEQLLLYYEIKKGKASGGKMTLPQFIDFLVNDVSKDRTYGSMLGKGEVEQLKAMQTFTDAEQMTDPVDYRTAAAYLGMDEAAMKYLYEVYSGEGGEDPETLTVSLQSIVNFIIGNEQISSSLSAEQLQQLQSVAGIINLSVSETRFTAGQMAKTMGMKKADTRSIYLLYRYRHGQTGNWKLSPEKFINFMADYVLKDKSMKKQVGSSAEDLEIAKTIINGSVRGTEYTSRELAEIFSEYSEEMDEDSMSMIYKLYGSKHMYDEAWTMNLCTMIRHLDENIMRNPSYSSMIDADQKQEISDMREELDDAAELLEGEDYGRMIISADLEEDSEETRAFMKRLEKATDTQFRSECYFIGNTPMAYEMSGTFKGELNRITIITALFIFLIVLLTFRRLATPAILVLIIQCAVYVTMGVMTVIDFDMYYLALLIVQSIMMGATIDYAIIFTTYYIEKREKLPPADSIFEAFRGSMQTILTSATILIAAVGILSFAFSEIATRQICRILSAGCLTATVLVIFVLPAVLACFDRLVIKKTGSKK